MSDLLNGLRHIADDHPCCAATISAAIGQLEQLESGLMEQCRLNGMGSEREASMLAQIERLQRENARLQMELDGTCNAEELRQVREENAKLKQATYEAMHAMDELAALRKVLADATELERNPHDDGHWHWADRAHVWLRRDEVIAIISATALAAARKEAKP